MVRRILMTGGTGYLGSLLAKALVETGYGVVVLKRKTSSLQRIAPIKSRLVLLDAEGIDWRSAIRDCGDIDAIINLAANYGRSGESVSRIVDANLNLPLSLMEAAVEEGVRLFVNTDTALDKFLNAYSLSKRQLAEWGRYFSKREGIRFINLKLEHFFGAGDGETKFTTQVIKGCLENTPELKLTLGEQRRDFIYVDDVIAAYLLLLEKNETLGRGFMEFDVGSGEAVSVRHFVELVHRLTASTTRLNFGAYPYREGEAMFLQADTGPLTKLGWRCKHSLPEGLRLTIEGYRQ